MADRAAAPAAPVDGETAPALTGDDAKWAALFAENEAEESGIDEEAGEDLTPATVDDEREAIEAKAPAEPKAKPTYEQLEANYKNAQGAFKALQASEKARERAEQQVESFNRMVEELRASRQARQAPKEPEAPKIPDVLEDPIGHFQARLAERDQVIEQLQRNQQQTTQQTQAQREEQQCWGHIETAEAEFRKSTPTVNVNGREMTDYDAACEHLKSHRMAQLTMMYPDNNPVAHREAQQHGFPTAAHYRVYMLQQDAMGIAARAFQLGISPAQMYYDTAKGVGYVTPEQRPSPSLVTPKPKPNGKIASQRAGLKSSLSISGGEGRRSNVDMSMSDLSDLYAEGDYEAFDREWEA